MGDYITAAEMARSWGITPRRIQILCAEGKIAGAVKFGRAWAVPMGAPRPEDGRIKRGRDTE